MIIECLLGGILFQQLTGLKVRFIKKSYLLDYPKNYSLNHKLELNSLLLGPNLGGNLFNHSSLNKQQNDK